MKKNTKGYLAVSDRDRTLWAKEQFKGEVNDPQVKFPKELGAEHPFNFLDVDNLVKHNGVVAGALNKIKDAIMGEFQVKCQDENAKKIIDDFNDDGFIPVLGEWIFEGLKHNGFMDLSDLKNGNVKNLPSEQMYIARDVKGTVKGFNQYIGKTFTNFSMNSRKVISFTPDEIAHLKINACPGEAYGYGFVMPNERVIQNLVLNEQDLQKLITRKAGAPIHVKVGQPGEIQDNAAVDNIKTNLVYMTNRTEWCTDANVDMKVLEFGEIGKNLTDNLMYNFRMLLAGMHMAEVLMGSGQLNEGIAKVQLEGFQRFISSLQEQIENIVENKIYKPLLHAHGMDFDVEFIWNLPGEEEINARITQLNTTLQNQYLSDGMRKQIQLEIARLLNFEDAEALVNTPNSQGQTADKNPIFDPAGKLFEPKGKENPSSEKDKEKQLKQPEVPGAKPNANSMLTQDVENVNKEKDCVHKHTIIEKYDEMSIREFVNLVEVSGFNYSDYLINILKALKTDSFSDLQGISESDIQNGMLSNDQIEKLRTILKNAFKKNFTMQDIKNEIKASLDLKDRIKEDGSTIPADARPEMISRTETVRLANIGLLNTYKENDIQKVRWLAALSDRTCEICEANNGMVMNLEEAYGEIPAHVSCRCSWLSILE